MNDKYLTWLPDEKATVQVENRIGPVHPAAPDTFYDDVIQAMDGGEELSGMTSARQELRKQIRSVRHMSGVDCLPFACWKICWCLKCIFSRSRSLLQAGDSPGLFCVR